MTQEIVPRRTALVPRPPAPTRPVRPVRAWLRELFTPPHPLTYLAVGERCIGATRRHWSVPLWRLARGARMMTVIGVLTFLLPGWFVVQVALALGAIAHTAWITWCILDWRVEQIVVTDTRLIRVSGILRITVDTVLLAEVTDLSSRCSVLGRLLGYSTLRVETAGQDRALTRLDFLPSTVCRAMLTGALSGR
ncbi:MAG: PH domain-containing protein [Actinobacteria bacterium]|nr:PH domain-containing protein [Actinomycetota bacterium]